MGGTGSCNTTSVRGLVADPARVAQSHVILGLSEVTFVDASALGAIVHWRHMLAECSVDLSLVCPEGHILRVLRLVGIERVPPIHANLDEAFGPVLRGRLLSR